MRVWVSGASGFTGLALIKALNERGDQVFASNTNLLDGDAIDREMHEFVPEAIVHLAGISQPTHQPASDFYAVHVIGTQHVLSAAEHLSSKPKVVIASSAHVYGRCAERHPVLSEDLLPEPTSHYALSKRAMEQLCDWFPNLDITLFRPFNYTGPGQRTDFLFPKIADHLRMKKPRIELGSLRAARDLCWIDDVVTLYLSALDHPGNCAGIFNICSGVTQSIEELVKAWLQVVDFQIEVVFSEHFVRNHEISSLCGATARIEATFGFVPRPLSIDLLNGLLSD